MASLNEITGGAFQDALGNALAGGSLIFELSQDAQVNDTTQVVSGYRVTVDLDGSGNVVAGSEVWPNDVLLPANTYYNVTAYNADGQRVWGPNPQQVISTPSPFNIGTWVPQQIAVLPPAQLVIAGTTLATTATGGAETLPANPVAFLPVLINGTSYKIALYAV